MSRWHDIPFRPRRWPFFYGWFILVVGTLGVLMSIPGQTMGVSPFTDPLLAALSLTRSQLSLAYMVGTGLSALLLTPAGKLYDKLGARAMGTGVCVALALVLLYLSQIDRISGGLRSVGLHPLVANFSPILLGFWMVRLTGQGVLTLISRNMVMKWFDHHRGLANGIMAVFVALGFSLAPLLLLAMKNGFGWRGAWQVMAAAIGGVFALVVWLTWRDNPEQCGLSPDGASDELTAERHKQRPVRKQFTLAEAARTYAFWTFSLSLAMFGLYQTGLTFHLRSIFAEKEMSEQVAYSIFLPATVISIPLSLAGGWIGDHIQLKRLLSVMVLGLGLSMVGLMILGIDAGRFTIRLSGDWSIGGGLGFWTLVVGNGICGGLFGVLSAFTWPKYFGREHLGAVSGLNMALVVFGSAIGPLAFSLGLDWTKTYAAAALACLCFTALLFIGSFFANDPHPDKPRVPPAENVEPDAQD